MSIILTPEFSRLTTDLYGERGRTWLDALPALAAEYEERWQIRLLPPFALSYNYVTPVLRADGSRAVLKLGVPNPLLRNEIAALQWYGGSYSVEVLEADPERGVFLMEYLSPGDILADLGDDDQETIIAAEVMRGLWRPLPPQHSFPSTQDWADGLKELRPRFEGGCGPFSPHLVDAAERLFAELHASQAAPVLLHGDLHHYNIVAAQRRPWLVIDPQGVCGEPAYEVGALIRNPDFEVYPLGDLRVLFRRRLDLLSELLELDRQRLLGWSLAQAVLSVWWAFDEEGRQDPRWLEVAEALYQIM